MITKSKRDRKIKKNNIEESCCTLNWWWILARCWWTASRPENTSRKCCQRTIFCAQSWAISVSSVSIICNYIYIRANFLPKKEFEKGGKTIVPYFPDIGEPTLVISLCVFWASSSALCWQEGSNRAKSAKSLSKDSLAAKSNLITSCWTSFACWILVAEPTHLVVVSYNDYEFLVRYIFFFSFSLSRVCVTTSEIDWDRLNEAKLV